MLKVCTSLEERRDTQSYIQKHTNAHLHMNTQLRKQKKTWEDTHAKRNTHKYTSCETLTQPWKKMIMKWKLWPGLGATGREEVRELATQARDATGIDKKSVKHLIFVFRIVSWFVFNSTSGWPNKLICENPDKNTTTNTYTNIESQSQMQSHICIQIQTKPGKGGLAGRERAGPRLSKGERRRIHHGLRTTSS